jgi:hypothetical protein
MACPMLSYNNISQAAWEEIKKDAANYGLAGDSGQSTEYGCTITWSFDKNKGTLHIQCIDPGWLFDCATVNSKIQQEIDKYLQTHGIQMAHMVP